MKTSTSILIAAALCSAACSAEQRSVQSEGPSPNTQISAPSTPGGDTSAPLAKLEPSPERAEAPPAAAAEPEPASAAPATTATDKPIPPPTPAGPSAPTVSKTLAPAAPATAAGAPDTGETESDIPTAIQRAILADRTLNAVAKNVRVTAVGNKVTLRGNVNTKDERRAIERIARSTDGVRDVTNLLQVNE